MYRGDTLAVLDERVERNNGSTYIRARDNTYSSQNKVPERITDTSNWTISSGMWSDKYRWRKDEKCRPDYEGNEY
ncbi:hypothetical protein DPMN_135822 [Dreissena polymorpha]|uniref:Uncharacterized protein n=1 Tax=Dreissena polymorpha TaxID=45954 RepID=A0A9D4FZU7_DREPO|nr:hypothetical protein DPMN_135821 [Dreissena polymorpha]KAH3807481.1 hypothetical protein DPMN_135822 [Dreissena polymorpha]